MLSRFRQELDKIYLTCNIFPFDKCWVDTKRTQNREICHKSYRSLLSLIIQHILILKLEIRQKIDTVGCRRNSFKALNLNSYSCVFLPLHGNKTIFVKNQFLITTYKIMQNTAKNNSNDVTVHICIIQYTLYTIRTHNKHSYTIAEGNI